jgi:hypothetical protein
LIPAALERRLGITIAMPVTALIDQKACLLPIRSAVLSALDLMQLLMEYKLRPLPPGARWNAFQLGKTEAEIRAILSSGAFFEIILQGMFLWDRAVVGEKRIAWMVGRNDVLVSLFLLLCDWAQVKPLNILDGYIASRDFPSLTKTGSSWADSDLHIWDAAHYGCDFRRVNRLLKTERSADHFVCDWELEGSELNGAKHFLRGRRTTVDDITDLFTMQRSKAHTGH